MSPLFRAVEIVIFVVVAAWHDSFISSPCATPSTYPLFAPSLSATGSAKFVIFWLAKLTAPFGAVSSFNLLVLTPVSKSLILECVIEGISEATSDRNVGAAADPVVGPANIAFALLVSVLLKNPPAPPITIIAFAYIRIFRNRWHYKRKGYRC